MSRSRRQCPTAVGLSRRRKRPKSGLVPQPRLAPIVCRGGFGDAVPFRGPFPPAGYRLGRRQSEGNQPKTEHHPGKESRVIPCSRNCARLEKAFELAPKGSVNSCEKSASRRWGRRVGGGVICGRLREDHRRAGLTAWPRLFHNLRASRETELMERFPIRSS